MDDPDHATLLSLPYLLDRRLVRPYHHPSPRIHNLIIPSSRSDLNFSLKPRSRTRINPSLICLFPRARRVSARNVRNSRSKPYIHDPG